MLKRRIFFKHAGAFALGTLFLPACGTKEEKSQANDTTAVQSDDGLATQNKFGAIGLQLYSVKDVLDQDLKGTLQKLADMGYKEIESYPGNGGHYYGMEPQEFTKMVNDMGMELVSSHFGSGSKDGTAESWHQATMLTNFEALAEKAAETGQKYLTCSWMDESLRRTPDDLKRTAELFNKTGEICKNAGLQFAYHNHDFEFEKVGDHILYDFMLENTDPDLVKYEMDIFWVVAGGQDAVAYFEKYPDRFPLCHVKDMDPQDKSKNAVIGKGSIDFKRILKAAEDAGMKHYLVEQESFVQSPMDAMRENFDYLSQLEI